MKKNWSFCSNHPFLFNRPLFGTPPPPPIYKTFFRPSCPPLFGKFGNLIPPTLLLKKGGSHSAIMAIYVTTCLRIPSFLPKFGEKWYFNNFWTTNATDLNFSQVIHIIQVIWITTWNQGYDVIICIMTLYVFPWF